MAIPAIPRLLRPPDVVVELIDLLQASAVAGAQTLIRWGLLPELPTQRERVYLLGVTGYLLAPASRAHRARREDFAVRGLIEVQQLGGQGPEASARRAWELLTGFDDALCDEQLDCGAKYTGALRVAGDEVVPGSDGWLARIVFQIDLESVR